MYILKYFVKYCVVDHVCAGAGCKTVIVIDGNMKNARQVCSCANVGELYFDGMPGSILVGEFC